MNDQDLERGMSSMTSFIMGAALGAGLALLLAPDRGSETRRRVGQTMKRFGSQVNDQMGDVKENVRSAVNSGRDAFRRTSDDLRSNAMGNEQSGMTNP